MRRIGAMLGLLLATAACGNKDGREVASGTVSDGEGGSARYSVREEGDGTSMTVKSDQGTATIRTGADAAVFPTGLTPYPGATITSGTAIDSQGTDGGKGTIIAFESADAPSRIVAHYKKAATAAGYEIEGEMTMNQGADGEMVMIGGKRGEESFNLTATRTDGKTNATLIAGLQ